MIERIQCGDNRGIFPVLCSLYRWFASVLAVSHAVHIMSSIITGAAGNNVLFFARISGAIFCVSSFLSTNMFGVVRASHSLLLFIESFL